MSGLYRNLDQKKGRDILVLRDFIRIYCKENHRDLPREAVSVKDAALLEVLGGNPPALCEDCRRLFQHGTAKLMLCPYDPKPMCKKCTTHCYAPGYREKIREVMRFSGLYLVKHGRVDMLLHYFF